MRIRLAERRRESPGALSFLFDLGGRKLPYLPGQYLTFELDALAFPDERGPGRHFTISSSPTEEGVVMFTTRLRGSGFKETLRHAPLGLELSCGTPTGRFVLPEGESRRHVFLAGGIGVTPFRSILRHAADSGARLDALMLYHSRSQGEIVFGEELGALPGALPGFSLVNVLGDPAPGWTGETGTADGALVRRHVRDPGDAVFWVSGPPAFVNAYREILAAIGVDGEAVRAEGFAGY